MAAYVDQRKVKADEADVRLDRWFQRHFPAITHGHLAKLLRTGQVRVDGKRAEGKLRLQPGQMIRIPPLNAALDTPAAKAKKLPLNASKIYDYLLYDDDDVVIINKPAGLAVQGGTGIKESLDDWLAILKLDDSGESGQPRLVHRLDRETSGVLVIARNTFAATKLTAAFRGRDVKKYYVALAHGKPAGYPKVKNGEISAPLAKHGLRMAVDKSGDVAISHYRVLGYNKEKNVCALLLEPYTGRTHQLRVHALHIGCPLLGDPLYGDKEADKALGVKGLHLHSIHIAIPHPRTTHVKSKAVIDVSAPLPMLQQTTWDECGFDSNLTFEDGDS